jgi:hypothetical protein
MIKNNLQVAAKLKLPLASLLFFSLQHEMYIYMSDRDRFVTHQRRSPKMSQADFVVDLSQKTFAFHRRSNFGSQS